MQSSENKPPSEDKNSGGQKSATQDHQPPHKCPRCDSSNTKFCYYNNYSLSQPRHFCKTCRRYWTRGGSLRNIPVGGGCRKTKKLKSAAAAAAGTRLFSGDHPGDLGFQLHPGTEGMYTQTQFVSGSGPGFGLDLFGLNYPNLGTTLVGQGSGDHKISISSIESLSSINQEMHWKLQQQRLAVVYDHHDHDHGNQKEKGELHGSINLFRNLEFSVSNNNNIPTNICGDNGTKLEVGPRDWSFEPTNYAPNVTTTTANSDINREEEEDGAANVAVAWSDLHQFNGFQ